MSRDEPTDQELRVDATRLLTEVDNALSSDRWAILDTGSPSVKHRLYDAAALKHCCQLLKEIEQSSKIGQELGVRILGRAHLEAWIFALYLHFGGNKALDRIAEDTFYSLQSTGRAHAGFDQWLSNENKSVRKTIKRIRQKNAEIRTRNSQYPDLPPMPLHDEPHTPQLQQSGVDLSDWMKSFAGLHPRRLPVEQVVDQLTELGAEKKFSNESLRPLYLNYRLLSFVGIHPTLHVFDSYLQRGNFIRIAEQDYCDSSLTPLVRITSLKTTAFLAARVLGDSGWPTPAADEICE